VVTSAHPPAWRPTKAEIAAAAGRTLPELLAEDLTVLFCGINPGLRSAATGYNFDGPGNRFWPTLHGSGCTPRLLRAYEQDELLGFGLGITSLVARASARADELSVRELQDGAVALTERVGRLKPRMVAMLGITAYRSAFRHPKAVIGPQPDLIAGRPMWVLPNPSGLNAHWPLPALIAEFARMRAVAITTPPASPTT
jgi:TDG/mug DNA glycosylase family protein